MHATDSGLRAALCVVALALSGCAIDSYKYVKKVNPAGTVHIIEHGERKQLKLAEVYFTSGMGYWREYLTPAVPAREDAPAVRKLIHDTPVERYRTNLLSAAHAVGYHADGYPWHGRLHWIIESDPLVVAIGGPQGREAERRGRERGTRYPLVGSADLPEHVTHLLVFRDGVRRLHTRDRDDASSAPHEVVELPRLMTLDEVLTSRGNPDRRSPLERAL